MRGSPSISSPRLAQQGCLSRCSPSLLWRCCRRCYSSLLAARRCRCLPLLAVSAVVSSTRLARLRRSRPSVISTRLARLRRSRPSVISTRLARLRRSRPFGRGVGSGETLTPGGLVGESGRRTHHQGGLTFFLRWHLHYWGGLSRTIGRRLFRRVGE